MQRYLGWLGVEKEDVAKLEDGILISNVKLDGDQPPVDVLYVKYKKVKPFLMYKLGLLLRNTVCSIIYRFI